MTQIPLFPTTSLLCYLPFNVKRHPLHLPPKVPETKMMTLSLTSCCLISRGCFAGRATACLGFKKEEHESPYLVPFPKMWNVLPPHWSPKQNYNRKTSPKQSCGFFHFPSIMFNIYSSEDSLLMKAEKRHLRIENMTLFSRSGITKYSFKWQRKTFPSSRTSYTHSPSQLHVCKILITMSERKTFNTLNAELLGKSKMLPVALLRQSAA